MLRIRIHGFSALPDSFHISDNVCVNLIFLCYRITHVTYCFTQVEPQVPVSLINNVISSHLVNSKLPPRIWKAQLQKIMVFTFKVQQLVIEGIPSSGKMPSVVFEPTFLPFKCKHLDHWIIYVCLPDAINQAMSNCLHAPFPWQWWMILQWLSWNHKAQTYDYIQARWSNR